MPATVLLARFQHHYPGLYTSPRYRTTGAVIPFGLFWLYQRRMHVDLALERINQTRAITHALALAFATKGQGPTELTRAEFREAYVDGGTD